MSLFGDESNGDQLIDEYLSNFQSVRHDDDHFAKPIEDEDIFGLDPIEQQSEIEFPETQTPPQPATSISKLELFKKSIKEKLLAKGIVPKPLEHGRNKQDLIEIDPGQSNELVPPARLIFQHAQQKNTKDKYGLYRGQKLKWNAYSDHLKKSMCSDKRKQWDSFQSPVDDYDDEEELVERVEHETGDCDKDDGDKEIEDQNDDDCEEEDADEDEEQEEEEEEEDEAESEVGDEEEEGSELDKVLDLDAAEDGSDDVGTEHLIEEDDEDMD